MYVCSAFGLKRFTTQSNNFEKNPCSGCSTGYAEAIVPTNMIMVTIMEAMPTILSLSTVSNPLFPLPFT
jgi:hypothetical protein